MRYGKVVARVLASIALTYLVVGLLCTLLFFVFLSRLNPDLTVTDDLEGILRLTMMAFPSNYGTSPTLQCIAVVLFLIIFSLLPKGWKWLRKDPDHL
jgi:hypothetical protein